MTTTTTPPATDLPPLFGERLTQERRCEFRLMSYGSNGEQEHLFTARAEIDASTALAATRGGVSSAASAMEKFFIRVLVDDDGVPQRDKPRPVTDEDTDETDENAVALRDAMHSGDWEIDGKTFPSKSLAEQHAKENGSSLRRFAELMDDPFATVTFEALTQILSYVMEQAGQRPLAPSRRSSQRRTQKRR